MNAREALIIEGADPATIDAYAHELAEVLRDSIGRDDYPGEPEQVTRLVEGYRLAADAIDPFKETK